jgi:alpha-L-fucosidase
MNGLIRFGCLIKKDLLIEHMIPQFKDLVTKYKPSVIFSDGEWELSDTAWKSEDVSLAV